MMKYGIRVYVFVLFAVLAIFGLIETVMETTNAGNSADKGSNLIPKPIISCAKSRTDPPLVSTSRNQQAEGVCSLIPEGLTTASLWKRRLADILEGSVHPLDTERVHLDWTKNLLELMTPHLLEQGLRVSPDYDSMERALKVLNNRLKNETARPLEVLVMGGSVTEGRGCDTLPEEIPMGSSDNMPNIKGNSCAWAQRLQNLLDATIGKGVVRIHNLAFGGTGTLLSLPITDYWLYPENSPLRDHGADIIINAYATNDNLPIWNLPKNTTSDWSIQYDRHTAKIAKFLEVTRRSRPCRDPPVTIFFDEYLGNQQDVIIGEGFLHEVNEQFAQEGGTGYISSADVVRSFVYGDADETLFSAPLWRKRVEVHFGMPGHVMISWVMAYAFLQATVNHCEDVRQGLPTLERSSPLISPDALQLSRSAILPGLHVTEQLSSLSQTWQEKAAEETTREQEFCSHPSSRDAPCTFAFVAAQGGTVRDARQVDKYVSKFAVNGTGWQGKDDVRHGWQNKHGLVATRPHSSITLRFDKLEKEIRTLQVHSLKSYGEMWEGSMAKFSIKISNNRTLRHEESFTVEGFHDQQTSISYANRLDLGENVARVGETVDLKIDLVNGTTFKIISMMLCSR